MDLDRQLISSIDPSLNYVKVFCVSTTRVYQVMEKSLFYILKVAQGMDEWQIEHSDKEKRNLIILKDIPGISHLIKSYNSEYIVENWYFRNPILKEFIEGNTANKIRDNSLQTRLKQTICEIHKRGIAGLNLENSGNIIISPNQKEATIIDLGTGRMKEEIGSIKFKWYKYRDLKNLEKYIFQ